MKRPRSGLGVAFVISSAFVIRASSLSQTCDQHLQEVFDFGWVSEQITCCSRFGLLTDENPYPALLQCAEGVLVSLIITDVDGQRVSQKLAFFSHETTRAETLGFSTRMNQTV